MSDPPATLAEELARLRMRVEAEQHTLNPLTLQSLATVFGRLSLFCSEAAARRQRQMEHRTPQGTDRQWSNR